ncbi:hypothetical protein [Zavarzinella formosa]|uniref:hypothetical protein n=1 Tax=Zavarzinella formosa TaxID=360055 RepID=UPI0002FA10E3|nr:hypothetical protein [Zavarzinella formosa]
MKLIDRRTGLPLLFLMLSAGVGFAQDTPEKLLEEFPIVGATNKAVFRREGNSMLINVDPPEPAKLPGQRGINLWQTSSAFALGGDFEFIANYDVRKLGRDPQKVTNEVNAELSLSGRGQHGIMGINVNSHPESPSCFRVLRVNSKGDGGLHFNMLTFPRVSTTGRIGMKRQGDEVVFLAADGPDAPLVELVRYPSNPLVSPNLRISAYQGNGADLQPLNVLFSNFVIKAARIIRGPEATQAVPPAIPVGKYALQLDYSKNAARILTDFGNTNDNAGVFKVEGDGLRVVPPTLPAYSKEATGYWFRDSRFALEGDFEVSMKYRVNKASFGSREGYGSVSLNINFETESPIGSISFGRSFSKDVGHRYGITRYSPHKVGHNYDTMSVRTTAMSGRLIVQRVGAEMIFSAQEGDNPGIREIARMPYVTAPIRRLRLATDMGGNCTNVIDTNISDLTVKSGKLVDPESGRSLVTAPAPGNGDTQTIMLDSVPQPKSRKWLYIGISGGIFALLLLGAAVILVRRGLSPQR